MLPNYKYQSTKPNFTLTTRATLTTFLVLIININIWSSGSILSRWIVTSHRVLHTSFAITLSGSCSYHCGAPSKTCLAHSHHWIYLQANTLHSLAIRDTVSFSTPHVLDRGDSAVLSTYMKFHIVSPQRLFLNTTN